MLAAARADRIFRISSERGRDAHIARQWVEPGPRPKAGARRQQYSHNGFAPLKVPHKMCGSIRIGQVTPNHEVEVRTRGEAQPNAKPGDSSPTSAHFSHMPCVTACSTLTHVTRYKSHAHGHMAARLYVSMSMCAVQVQAAGLRCSPLSVAPIAVVARLCFVVSAMVLQARPA